MKFRFVGNAILALLVVLALGGVAAASEYSSPAARAAANDQQKPKKIDPKEEAAYKAFYNIPEQQGDAKIQAANDFLHQYPASRYVGSVYDSLIQLYYDKQDWKNFYDTADKALALNPDDVSALVTVGWVIPHVYDEKDPNAAQNLDKSERYEKHAIELIPAMPKPGNLTDAQFAQSKSDLLSQAYSGLGITYYREHKSADQVTALQQSVQGAANPDPTDLYVLALGLDNLHRYPEAADAYNKCAQIPGALQDTCKDGATASAKKSSPPR